MEDYTKLTIKEEGGKLVETPMPSPFPAEPIPTGVGNIVFNQPLVPAQPEISAAELVQEPELQISPRPVEGATATANGILDSTAGLTTLTPPVATTTPTDTEIAKLTEEKKTLWEKMKELVSGKPKSDTTALLTSAQQKWGVGESWKQIQTLLPEIASLRDRITKIDAREQTELDRLEAQSSEGVGITFIRGEQNEVKRKYERERMVISSELSAKAAIAEMYQGNIQQARGLISDTVDAATYDIQQQRQDMDDLYKYHSDYLDSLDSEMKTLLNNKREDLIRQENTERQNWTAKLNWMTNKDTVGAFEGLSIKQIKDMSVGEVAGKVNAYLKESSKGALVSYGDKDFDISTAAGIQEYTKVAGIGATAKASIMAVLDTHTNYSATTKEQMLKAGGFPEEYISVSSALIGIAKELETLPSTVPKNTIKELIRSYGIDPDSKDNKDYFKPFLKRFK